MASPTPYRVDMHSHMLPPFYRKACLENGHANPDGMPFLPEWSEESHLALMDTHNIRKSILSISSPGTHLVPGNSQLAASLTRQCNAYSADLKRRLPERFGYFASLPLPDVESSLREIPLALAEGCDGFVVETNCHGVYPGADRSLDAVFDELNRRRATLFIHPATPTCPCTPAQLAAGQLPQRATPLASLYVNPMMEFLFDTARFVANMFLSGTLRRCSDLRLILPHLGGAAPPLVSRWAGFGRILPGIADVSEQEIRRTFADRVWFDLAGFPFPGQIRGLMDGVGVGWDRIVYGSDFPFTPEPAVKHCGDRIDEGVSAMFESEEQVEAIYHGNAENLLSLKMVVD